ncbi:MAG: hypothetical protein SGBAC_012389 [Bacillariaceae sp.]
MTSLSFMVTLPSPGEKGSKQHGRAPMTSHQSSSTAEKGNEYIFPSPSDLGSAMGDDYDIPLTTAATSSSATPPPSKDELKLSAHRLRSLRRQRLSRDNRGETKEEEVKYDYAYPAGLFNLENYNPTYLLSMGSQEFNSSDVMPQQDAASQATFGDYGTPSQNEFRQSKRRKGHSSEESKVEDDSSPMSYYNQFEAYLQNISTSMMETMLWCGDSVAPGDAEDATIVADESSISSKKALQQEQQQLHQNSSDQSPDPFHTIQNPKVAAILKKRHSNGNGGYFNTSIRSRDSRSETSSYTSTDTHLRALEIIARNKELNRNKAVRSDETIEESSSSLSSPNPKVA